MRGERDGCDDCDDCDGISDTDLGVSASDKMKENAEEKM